MASGKSQEEQRHQGHLRPINYESQFSDAEIAGNSHSSNSDTANFYNMINHEMGEVFTEYTKRR